MSLDQLRQVRAVQRLCYLSMSLLVLVVLLNPFNPASRLLQCEINLVSSQADSNPCWRKSLYITWPNLPSLDSSKTHFIWSIYPRKKWSIKTLASLSTHFSPASSQYVIMYCVVAKSVDRKLECLSTSTNEGIWFSLVLLCLPPQTSLWILQWLVDTSFCGIRTTNKLWNKSQDQHVCWFNQSYCLVMNFPLLSVNHPQQRCKSGMSSSLGYNWVCLCKSPYRIFSGW